MIKVIYVLRIFIGLVAVWQIIGLLPVLTTWLPNLRDVTGDMWAFAFIKVVVMFLCGGVYFWLGRIRNRLDETKEKTSEGRIIGLTIFALVCVGVVLAVTIPAFSDRGTQTANTPAIPAPDSSSVSGAPQPEAQQDQPQSARVYPEPKQAEIDWVLAAVALEESDPTDLQGQFDLAKTLVSREPQSILGWSRLGRAYEELDQFSEAQEAFLYAIQLDPSVASAWAGLGRLHVRAGRYDQAEDAFERAVAINPDDIDYWEKLGILYHLRGNKSGTVDVYQRLLSLDQGRAATFFESHVLP